eukprot:SAG22_NODE_463_length_10196_cov_4.491928_3_plen_292_part_00
MIERRTSSHFPGGPPRPELFNALTNCHGPQIFSARQRFTSLPLIARPHAKKRVPFGCCHGAGLSHPKAAVSFFSELLRSGDHGPPIEADRWMLEPFGLGGFLVTSSVTALPTRCSAKPIVPLGVQFFPPSALPMPVPMCTMANDPSCRVIGAALCAQVLMAMSANLNGPVGLCETECSILEFELHYKAIYTSSSDSSHEQNAKLLCPQARVGTYVTQAAVVRHRAGVEVPLLGLLIVQDVAPPPCAQSKTAELTQHHARSDGDGVRCTGLHLHVAVCPTSNAQVVLFGVIP